MQWLIDLFKKILGNDKPSTPPVAVNRPAIDAKAPAPNPEPKKKFSSKTPKEDKIMKMSDRGLELLTQWEGFELNVYKDSAGLPTIGVGHLLTKDELSSGKLLIEGETVKFHNGLTHQQVVDLLGQDVRRFEDTVRNTVTVDIEQHQFDALASFCFNVGQRAFKNSTLLKRINAMNWDDVPYQFSRWNKAGGRVVKGLINRRNNEIKRWNGEI